VVKEPSPGESFFAGEQGPSQIVSDALNTAGSESHGRL
jgi:hypothetical protein